MKAQAQKTVNILSREVIALTGVILYTILSSDGVTKYFATVQNNETFCECRGFEYRGTCRHAQCIAQIELNANFDIHSAVDEVVEAAENAMLDAFYSERGAALQAAREASAAELLAIDAETQAHIAVEETAASYCESCGKLSKRPVCYRCQTGR